MDVQHLKVLPIHKYPEFMTECCELINDEWPRSETARMMMLSASCDTLPTCLVLINDKKIVLGHCKLTRIPTIPESCFLESVVITKALRGQGLGTFLMKEVEGYCKNVLKLSKVHLSTKGQENFYAKLGYEICAPVSIYGVTRLPTISINSSYKAEVTSVPNPNETVIERIPLPPPWPSQDKPQQCSVNERIPPPPPMPPQSNITSLPKSSILPMPLGSIKTYMCKNI